MKTIQRKDLMKLAGIDAPLFDQWRAKGIIRHPISLAHTTGICSCSHLRRQGVALRHALRISAFISAMTPAKIQTKFDRGFRFAIMETQSGQIMWTKEQANFKPNRFPSPAQFIAIDVQAVFKNVRPAFDAIAKDYPDAWWELQPVHGDTDWDSDGDSGFLELTQ